MQNPPTVRIGGQVSKSLYQYSMQSPDREELYAASRKLKKALGERAGPRGSHERPRDHEPAGQRRDRSRQGRGARRHGQSDRERVLRRLRTALGLDDLRAGQRVQGAARARAAVPGRPGGALAALFQGDAHAGRRSGSRRERAAARRAAATGGSRRRHGAVGRDGGAARHARAHEAGGRTADGQSPRPAAGGDDLVRAAAGRVARHGADAACAKSRTPRCPKRSAASSRARPRRSRARSATSPCCSSSPSWSSTSCSASSTRATSTR